MFDCGHKARYIDGQREKFVRYGNSWTNSFFYFKHVILCYTRWILCCVIVCIWTVWLTLSWWIIWIIRILILRHFFSRNTSVNFLLKTISDITTNRHALWDKHGWSITLFHIVAMVDLLYSLTLTIAYQFSRLQNLFWYTLTVGIVVSVWLLSSSE